MSKKAWIDPSHCDNLPGCAAMRMCPAKAIKREGGGILGLGGKQVIDEAKCTGCGVCVRACPHGAIALR
ncbi:MAG: 4Fe-4S binding protein [Bacteroidota bacterium]